MKSSVSLSSSYICAQHGAAKLFRFSSIRSSPFSTVRFDFNRMPPSKDSSQILQQRNLP